MSHSLTATHAAPARLSDNLRRQLLLDAPVRPESSVAQLLSRAIQMRASDLHLHSDVPVFMRVDGVLRSLGDVALKADRIGSAIRELTGEARWGDLLEKGEIEFVCTLQDTRFRTTVLQQQRGVDAVFRLIPKSPPTLAQLGLPSILESLTEYRAGLVLCTGPVSCGKTTTLSALLNIVIQSRREHVLTLESPIEFLFESQMARVNQRQIGRDSESYAAALRGALREDPDVIAVAELHDQETMHLAMTAAETGHLVFGTLHTESAVRTISRMVNAFPADEQAHVRTMLSESLRAVVSQRLIRRTDGPGRVAAVEVLILTSAVANLIRDGKTHQIPSAMQVGRSLGMQTLDDSINQLIKAGVITRESADEAGLSLNFE